MPDLDRAFFDDRTLVKHLAMRRTLFAVARDLLPVVQAASSDRVAGVERRRLEKEVREAGFVEDAERWFDEVTAAAVDGLADGPLTAAQLREREPVLEGSIAYGHGKSWAGSFPVVSRVMTCLQAAGTIVRAGNLGSWTSSRPTWALAADWLGEPIPPLPEDVARAQLVERWLRRFGPGTTLDLKWWLGSTLTAVRQALRDVGAVEVSLDGGGSGWVLPDDTDPVGPVEPWVALLPALDPTTMGWSERDWYLGPHRAQVFDTAGNGGATDLGRRADRRRLVDEGRRRRPGPARGRRRRRARSAGRRGRPAHRVAARHVGHAPVPGAAGQPTAAIACWIRSATSSGWLIIATCELSISTVVDPARAAIARSAAGGITRSCDATRYQDGSVFQAGGPDGSPRVASAAGRCETAMIAACLRGQVLAERLREDRRVQVGVGVPLAGVRERAHDDHLGEVRRRAVAAQSGGGADRLALLEREGRDVDEGLDVVGAHGRVRDDRAAVGVPDEDDRTLDRRHEGPDVRRVARTRCATGWRGRRRCARRRSGG